MDKLITFLKENAILIAAAVAAYFLLIKKK